MHKDSLGEIIYVGKAVNLRNRVRSYFRASQIDPKVRAMVSNIAEFEYITCATEMEALILECNLIKKHMPRYNILLKDDKTYPYIEVTVTEEFPRVIRTRRLEHDGNRYFGPYSDVTAVWQLLHMIDAMYPLKKCRAKTFPAGVRPCLNYHIGKCKGVCIGEANRGEYLEMIDDILEVLSGRDEKLVHELERKMHEASELLNYEEAAVYRDYILALKKLGETQRATMVTDRDVDILIPVNTAKNSIVVLYKVRDGKMIGRDVSYVKADAGGVNYVDESAGGDGAAAGEDCNELCGELLGAFIKQHYTAMTALPREIILPHHIEDEELLEELLNRVNSDNAESRNDVMHKTRLVVPERGEKRALLKMRRTIPSSLPNPSMSVRTESRSESLPLRRA